MPLTDYITLGRSGLRVSPLCMGAMTFGQEWGFGATPEDSYKLIDAYLDAGGNFIDTANIYNKGHAEKILGDHLCSDPNKRDRVVIASKFGGTLYADDPNAGGSGRKSIIAACEQSLRRLRTDYIDLYWMHFWDKHTPIEESMRAFDDLVRSGKVRYIGFSDTPAWTCAQAQVLAQFKDWPPIAAVQLEYSLIERTLESEFIQMTAELGMGICPWSPLKGGILSGKYTREQTPEQGEGRYKEDSRYLTEKTFTIIEALVTIGKEINASPAQIALKWVQDRPGITSTIIGARTMEQLHANLAALELALSPEHTTLLNDLSEPTLSNPTPFLTTIGVAIHGGLSINGEAPEAWPLCPKSDDEVY